ncbi:transporter [Rhizobium sp. 2MFCol3.1]|uniref:SphA family protein n=1 Tax=Rhizobium sp. 2MFCol3.1 TaxID=1246459 RepID=UPI000381B312|nr:transporter [Rhizobium sp. 2MFCol3.1]
MLRLTKALIAGTFALSTITGLSTQAFGAEAITPAGPVGGTDIRSALLPPPGTYGGFVGVGPAQLDGLYAPDGFMPGDGTMSLGGGGLLHVWDTQIFGGSVASSLFGGYTRVCFGLQGLPEQCAKGFVDVYSDIFAWSRFFADEDFATQPAREGGPIPYGTALLVGLGTTLPIGTYKNAGGLNTGTNFFAISPNIGITHTMQSILGPAFGEATEFSARLFYSYFTENDATQYQTGSVLSMDYALTQRAGNWQFGLAGSSFVQLGDDKVNGVALDSRGTHAAQVNLGPLLSYDFMVNDHAFNITGKWLFSVYGENHALKLGGGPTIRISTKLF